ncbi:MAG TPA: glycogen synthase GlgA [Candidatus Omnitrophota bacterium]|nr:glycogen synthase GlgA [Candidatus Omnitrophota bacterium]HPS36430.1 glycogen synthase GlgA [Candidatus Omnitrophota bacterium]
MKILFVASEMAPFATTGGLGEVVGSLTGAVRGLGHDVSVFLPRYKRIDIQQLGLEIVVDYFEMIIGNQLEATRIFLKKLPNGVKVYFVEHPDYFMRDELYGTAVGDYQDNDRRFTYFQRAVLKAAEKLKLNPDVIHCHDWQTGLIPVYLKVPGTEAAPFPKARTLFTIHNLAYQGNYPPDSFPATGFGWELYKSDFLEFYGKFSFLKGGLVFADEVTTVSERYSREIQTKESGCGMEGVLAARKDSVTGIVNGIDPKDWDPETDSDIEAQFSLGNPSRKELNKAALQKENGFKVDKSIPVLGLVARLVDQKGVDILIPILEQLSKEEVQLVILGTGEEKYHQILRDIAKRNKKWFGVHILFDPKMAKRIYAGCDMLLFPSYYEPCGLGQIIGLRYGTVPVARATGGLADTIREFEISTQKGNGFLFEEYSGEAFLSTILRACKVFKQEKLWKALVKNAMESDFSWASSARKYTQLYETVKRRPVKVTND